MIKINIKHNDQSLSMDKLTFGTGIFTAYDEKESYFLLMDKYYENFKTFDTARSYNQWLEGGENLSESILGQWMESRGNREDIILVTKGGFPDNLKLKENVKNRITREDLTHDIDTSLSFLKTDYVDIFLLHRDDETKPVEEIMPILNDFVKAGKTRFIGVSNWKKERIEQANNFALEENLAPLVISQLFFSLAQSTAEKFDDPTIVCMDDEEYSWYEQNNMPVMAYTSQAKGFFSKYNTSTLSHSNIKRFLSEENIAIAQRVKKLAEEFSISPTCVALAYLTNNQVQTSAIIGSKNLAQLEDSVSVRDILLSQAQISWLKEG